jgi:hypothetical protein
MSIYPELRFPSHLAKSFGHFAAGYLDLLQTGLGADHRIAASPETCETEGLSPQSESGSSACVQGLLDTIRFFLIRYPMLPKATISTKPDCHERWNLATVKVLSPEIPMFPNIRYSLFEQQTRSRDLIQSRGKRKRNSKKDGCA